MCSINFTTEIRVGRLAPSISEKQMYADVAVRTRMCCVTEIQCQISRFCCHEGFNETL